MSTSTARAQRATRTPMSAGAQRANPNSNLATLAAGQVATPAPAIGEAVAPVAETMEGPSRPVRRPFGTRRQRLDNTSIPGFQCRWVNDLPGRIDDAKVAGYEHITDSQGKPVKLVVGVMEGGGPLVAYRMKIPREWYEQDQAAKEEPRTEIDAQMRQGDKDGGYASQGRPGYTETKVVATMTTDGRQSFGAKSQTPG